MASQCSIFLVHGTWGRGFFPKRREVSLYPQNKRWWFEEGSRFRAGLDVALKSVSLDWPIRAFLWSGANSVRARDDAARELSDQLRKELRDDPDARAVIIAHSHGGNVALRALQHLNSMAGQIKVVTLATPFLRVFAHRLQMSNQAAFLVFFSIFMIVVLCCVISIGWIRSAIGSSDIDVPDWDLPITFLLAGAIGNFITSRLFRILTNRQAALAIEEEASYDTKGLAALRMLVIRAVDDEASLSLAAGSLGSRLSYLVLIGVVPAVSAVITFGYCMMVIFFSYQVQSDLVDKLRWVVGFTMLSSLLFLVLPGVFKSFFFGREFLVNALVCDIAVDSVPDTLGQVEAITLKPVASAFSELEWQRFIFGMEVEWPYSSEPIFTLRWWSETIRQWRTGIPAPPNAKFGELLSLRHRIYDHPHCVEEIVRWLAASRERSKAS